MWTAGVQNTSAERYAVTSVVAITVFVISVEYSYPITITLTAAILVIDQERFLTKITAATAAVLPSTTMPPPQQNIVAW